jgi:Flp pilus assembly protein TadD
MNLPFRRMMLGLITLLPVLAACWILVARPSAGVLPLREVQVLAASGRVDQARALVADHLKKSPRDPRALLAAAELALEGPEPDPHRALALLETIDTPDRKLSARVQLDRGRSWERLGAMVEAEAAWKESIGLDPQIPEAGWSLLGLYYLQGRGHEARRTALSLHLSEPDPHDRVQLLLELVRQDTRPLDPGSVVEIFAPIVESHPEDRRSADALGLAWIRNSRGDKGVDLLSRTVRAHPDDLESLRSLLLGLELAGREDEIGPILDRLPEAQAHAPEIDRFRGRVAESRGDWGAAAEAYLRACDHDPSDGALAYRAGRVLKLAGRTEEAARREARAREGAEAAERLRAAYERADAQMKRSRSMAPELMLEIADLRERMGRAEEASAWRRLAAPARP